jgi:hypothetical protein
LINVQIAHITADSESWVLNDNLFAVGYCTSIGAVQLDPSTTKKKYIIYSAEKQSKEECFQVSEPKFLPFPFKIFNN